MVVLSARTPSHRNQKLCQKDTVALVQWQRPNQNAIDLPASATIAQQKDIPKRSTPTRSQANMMKFHRTRVLSHIKAQKHRELIGRNHAPQHTMATLQSLGRETTICIMLRIDHQNRLTMVTLGEDFDHHHRITGEDILGVHQRVHLGPLLIDEKVGTHHFGIAESDLLAQEEVTGHQAPEEVIVHLV